MKGDAHEKYFKNDIYEKIPKIYQKIVFSVVIKW